MSEEMDDIFPETRADIMQYKAHAKELIECALRCYFLKPLGQGWKVKEGDEYMIFDYKTPNCGHIEFKVEITGWGGPVQKCPDIIPIPLRKKSCGRDSCQICGGGLKEADSGRD